MRDIEDQIAELEDEIYSSIRRNRLRKLSSRELNELELKCAELIKLEKRKRELQLS